MSGNKGLVGSNNPSFLNLIRGTTLLPVGTPTSSASRIISRAPNGAPPQYVALYFRKYHPQLGNRFSGVMKGLTSEQISNATLRTASGFLLSIVAMLGRPFGVGNGPSGRSMSLGVPETSTVTSVTGYENNPLHLVGSPPRAGHGPGKSKLCRDGLHAGSIP